jgi:cation diffusion facilitator family transporter
MRAVVAAFAANLGIAVIKFVAFLLTGSASMLAESVHSVADTGNQVLLFVGRGRSIRPASDEHPFGFGRERYFYGFVVSVMLFTVGAAFSVYEGVHKIRYPEAVRSPQIAFGVLALSAVLEAFSLRTGIREANLVRGDRSWGTFIRRTKAPELPVVLLEDMAALIGLAFAFAGVALSVVTSNGRWDGAGSLAIGVLLATAAAILAVEMKSLLIGEAASPDMQRMIIAALEDGPELVRVIHLRTVHMSPDAVLVAAKIAIRESDAAQQITAGIDAAERRVRAAVPVATTIYLEPDIYRPQQPDRTDPSIRAVLRSRSPRPPRRDRPKNPGSPADPTREKPGAPNPEMPRKPQTPALTPGSPRPLPAPPARAPCPRTWPAQLHPEPVKPRIGVPAWTGPAQDDVRAHRRPLFAQESHVTQEPQMIWEHSA